MSSASLPPEKEAEIKDLAQAIREAVDAEISELAADLASTDDAHLFGQNEFKIRALAHKIAAKAVEQHLAGKKTATKAPQRAAPTATRRPSSIRTATTPASASSGRFATAAPITSAGSAVRACSPSTAKRA
jgi:hypothetical protein